MKYLLFLSASVMAACGGGGTSSTEICLDNSGSLTTYVANKLIIPTDALSAEDFEFDVDGDGEAENALGDILGLASSAIDVNGSVNTALAEGTPHLLLAMKATGFSTAKGTGMEVIVGDTATFPTDNPPCTPAGCDPDDMTMTCTCGGHLNGSTTFTVAGNTASNLLVGNTIGGNFVSAQGTIDLSIEITPGTPIDISLKNARIEAKQISETTIGAGRLGGAILQTDIEATLIPQIANLMNSSVTDECDLDGDGISQEAEIQACCGSTETDPDEICKSANQTNPTNQDACDFYCMWNTDDDFNIAAQDVKDGPAGAFLSPDVDLDGDGTKDAMSFGIGYEAVGAVFTAPKLSADQTLCAAD